MAETAASPPGAVKRLRYRLEAALAWSVFGMLKLLPLTWASGLAGCLARGIGPRLGVSRRARANLAMVFPDLARSDIDAIVADMWENIGRVAGEMPHLDRFFLARSASDTEKVTCEFV